MGTSSLSGSPGLLRAWPILILLSWPGAAVADSADAETARDCGVRALYLLLHLEGHPVDLGRLEGALPARDPKGYSMAELASAARSLGCDLEGVRARADCPPDRPSIVYLEGDRGGHFALLRPVGNTGTMVQVFDPPSAPRIMDYSRICESRLWTGRLLVARDPWITRLAVPMILATAGLIILAVARRGGRRTQALRGGPPAPVPGLPPMLPGTGTPAPPA